MLCAVLQAAQQSQLPQQMQHEQQQLQNPVSSKQQQQPQQAARRQQPLQKARLSQQLQPKPQQQQQHRRAKHCVSSSETQELARREQRALTRTNQRVRARARARANLGLNAKTAPPAKSLGPHRLHRLRLGRLGILAGISRREIAGGESNAPGHTLSRARSPGSSW